MIRKLIFFKSFLGLLLAMNRNLFQLYNRASKVRRFVLIKMIMAYIFCNLFLTDRYKSVLFVGEGGEQEIRGAVIACK